MTDTATAIDQTGLSAALGGVIEFIFAFVIASLFTAVAAIVLWIELQLRNAGVDAATLFMVLVSAGLVDRAMWRHVRRGVSVLLVHILAGTDRRGDPCPGRHRDGRHGSLARGRTSRQPKYSLISSPQSPHGRQTGQVAS